MTRIWLIAGPTASGKSALALALAQATGAEIVGADALQIYRDLPILSAAPRADERAGVPHHLIGVADAAEGWSVGRWLTHARTALAEIAGRNRPVVVVGGTGLYFKALTEGLAEIPPVPPAMRAGAMAEFADMGEAAFRARLSEPDPAAAARIFPGDQQRLVRAWSVFAATGRALSDWQAGTSGGLAPGSWRAVRLDPPRQAIYDRCDQRLTTMLDQGVLAEVARLAARNLDQGLPALKAVGYRELAAHLRGELGLEAALMAAQQETRRYAKRQGTWMRGQMADWPVISDVDPDGQWRALEALMAG